MTGWLKAAIAVIAFSCSTGGELEETTYDFLTELLANKGVSDATYERAVKALGEQGIIEVIGVTGYFAINAMIMNVARTPLRNGGAPTLAPLPRQLAPIG